MEKLEEVDLDGFDELTQKMLTDSCAKKCENYDKRLPIRTMVEVGLMPKSEYIDCTIDPQMLEEGLCRQVADSEHTDMLVYIGNRVFECHLCVLQVYTEYFKQFKISDVIRINNEEVTVNGFDGVYKWMIDPEAKPRRAHIVEVYLAARYFTIPDLLKQIWNCFDSTELIPEDSAFMVYLESLPFQARMVRELMLARIGRFFLCAVTSIEFLTIKADDVIEMLSHNNIAVNSEMEVLMAALRWLRHDWPARQVRGLALLNTVRFNLMPPWYLSSLQKRLPLLGPPELQEFLKTSELQSKISLGLSYSVTQHFINDESPLQAPLMMVQPPQRQWIFDVDCKHHHDYNCPNWQYLTYSVFTAYLKRIVEAGPNFYNTLKFVVPDKKMPCCQAAAEAAVAVEARAAALATMAESKAPQSESEVAESEAAESEAPESELDSAPN